VSQSAGAMRDFTDSRVNWVWSLSLLLEVTNSVEFAAYSLVDVSAVYLWFVD
jgi:hypothetical protein